MTRTDKLTTLTERAIDAVRVAGKHDTSPTVAGALVHIADELEAENLRWTDVVRVLQLALKHADSNAEREKLEAALGLACAVVMEERLAAPSLPRLTKQGVRDLDAELGPRRSRGRKLPPAPKQNHIGRCPHRRTYEVNELYDRCEDCLDLVFTGTEEDVVYNLWGRS